MQILVGNMMPPKGKNRSLHCDALSNLPENVMDEILVRLPLRDAVRTSILSKKWRYKWCRLSQLALDQTLWESVGDLSSLSIKLTNILYHLLTLHTGPISKLILDIPDVGSCPNIDNLICFLSRNEIQHFVLRLPPDTTYKLPSSFFACLQLRNLTLKSCLICPPPEFEGFGRLNSLELCGVRVSSKFLGRLISHCPLLEHLVLEPYYDIDLVEIDAPKLRSFIFNGFWHTIRLKNVPLLAEVSLELIPISVVSAGIMHNFAKFFESIPYLVDLRWKLFLVFANEIPRRLPSSLNCLKRLHLYLMTLQDSFVEFSCALCLIRSSPYLEDIEMKMSLFIRQDELLDQAIKDYIDEIPASFSDVTLNHLKAVKLEGMYGRKHEMQLIKVLLAKTPALVRMEINPWVNKDESLKVLVEITKFQRASSKAEVVYHIDERPIYS